MADGEQGWGDSFGWGSSLLQAYLKGEYKPVIKKGAKEAVNYGVERAGDWAFMPGDGLLDGGGFTPLGQGAAGGLGSLAGSLLSGDTEGMWGKAGTSAVGGYIGNAAGQAAVQGAGGVGAIGPQAAGQMTGVLGAGVGGIASGLYEGFTEGDLSLGTEWGTVGGMVGSIVPGIGTVVGSVIGNLAGSFIGSRHKKKPFMQARYDQGNAVIYDEKSGKFIAQQPKDFRVVNPYTKDEVTLTPEQREKSLRGTYAVNQKYADQLNQKFGSGYQNLSAEDAYQFDTIIDKFKPKSQPATPEDWEAEYRSYLNSAGGSAGEGIISLADYKRTRSGDSYQWAEAGKEPWKSRGQRGLYDQGTFMDDPATTALSRMGTIGDRPEEWRPWGLDKKPYTGSMEGDDGGWSDDLYRRKKKYWDTYKDKDRGKLSEDTAKRLDELQADSEFARRYNSEPAGSGTDADRYVDAQAGLADMLAGKSNVRRASSREQPQRIEQAPGGMNRRIAGQQPGLLDALVRIPEEYSMTT
jgi:hypothetical protein